MIHSEKQINEIALKALEDIQFPYDKEIGLSHLRFEKETKLSRGTRKGESAPVWVVSIEFGKPYFNNEAAFLTITDDTGEPIYLQHSTAIIEIEKDKNGKYTKNDL